MESRHSSSSEIKGSNISRADSSDDVTLDFLMLKWSSCETNTWFKEIQRKTWTVTVKSRWRQCYLKAGVHQDVHAGPAAHRRFPATSLGGREEEQAAGGRKSGVRWRLSQGFLSADGNVKDIVAHGKAKQKRKRLFFQLWFFGTGLCWSAAAGSRWPGRGTAARCPGSPSHRWSAGPRRLGAARRPPGCKTLS